MAKIIKIDGEIVSIGTDENGIKEVRKQDINFEPQIGDEVEVYETESNVIVIKGKEKSNQESNNSGINMNIGDSQKSGQSEYADNPMRVVNKNTYCLLAFFLGGLGAHKFYIEKTGIGILYILFCWTYIPWTIAFVEFIVALCKKPDVNGNIVV